MATTEPAVMTTRGSVRSSSQPTPMPAIAETPSAIVAASDSCDAVRPSSSRIGTKTTGNAYSRTP